MQASNSEITRLLVMWRRGNAASLNELIPLVYQELRQLASVHLAKERSNHTLQPTALVHELWGRLVRSDPGLVESRRHFFAASAQVMRRILVEHARRRNAAKRFGNRTRITLSPEWTPTAPENPDLLDVHRALGELSEVAPRQAQLVELRYFGGLTIPEAAQVLEVSVPTMERDWTAARLWLRRRLAAYGP